MKRENPMTGIDKAIALKKAKEMAEEMEEVLMKMKYEKKRKK